MTPVLVLLAGPNGAGKSTYYELHLRSIGLPFLNADVLAAESGMDSFEAARVLDKRRAEMIERGESFVTETVFSDPHGAKLDMLRAAVEAGFDVRLIYVGIANPELSKHRVAQRVAIGGHDVPSEKLAGRFVRSLENLKSAVAIVPAVKIYDNSSPTEPYRLLVRFENGNLVERADGRMPAWTRGIIPPARAAPKRSAKARKSRAPAPRKKR
jgi:predicted ABC-type ATPase